MGLSASAKNQKLKSSFCRHLKNDTAPKRALQNNLLCPD
jgi:hypothetical protein